MNRLAIIGASGHGKVLADIALQVGWSSVVFFDDAYPTLTSIELWKVVGTTNDFIESATEFDGVIVAIGNNQIRLKIQTRLTQANCNVVNLIHPHATVSQFVKLGSGNVIMAGAVISPFVTIGNACIINSNAVVEHDCILSDAVHLSPASALAGGGKVGLCSWIGIGAVTKQMLTITEHVIVGAGASVVNDLTFSGTYIGVPARKIIK
ncbi:MAG: acetyltransferase [Psychromonas sp.]|nr:acetyltransferase [Alteromonadales bacterium]MCP5077436.1 acetyltransferase [Psychromonas sp.]